MNTKQINEYIRVALLNYCDSSNLHQETMRGGRIIFLDGAKEMEDWELKCLLNSLNIMFYKATITEDRFGKMIRIQYRA